jgi:hypothetical protein
MRIIFCTCIALVLALSANAQNAKLSTKISDGYAKTPFLALKAISSDSNSPEVRDGQVLVAGNTQDKIDAADVEARTPREQKVTAALRTLFTHKLENNQMRELKRLSIEAALKQTNDILRRMAVEDAMMKDPEMMAMNRSEAACFQAFDSSLRARSATVPADCSSIAARTK